MNGSESFRMPALTEKSISTSQAGSYVPWRQCRICQPNFAGKGSGREREIFRSPSEFCQHLREFHATREGGSYICRYGNNGVCPSLPVEGVSDKDYEDHVARDHVAGEGASPKMNTAKTFDNRLTHSRNNSLDTFLSHSSTNNSASNVSSPSQPSIVTDQPRWTVYMSKVNLPAALNDPTLAHRETDFFTKTWGEGFERLDISPSPWIPVITKKHFESYLQKTSNRYKKHSRASKLQTSSQASSVTSSLTGLNQITDEHQTASGRLPSEMDVIPKLFMQPNFNLTEPETFNAVFPWNQIEASRQEQRSKASHQQSSKLLQEKLSHYLDLVEVQISKQVSLRSEAFFHAMVSHDELQDHLKTTCSLILHLRNRVKHLNEILVEEPLKILGLSFTRHNYVKVHNLLKLMSTVHQTQPTIQLLLATNEFVGALDLISTTQEVLSQELAGIHSFKHLGSQLVELEKMIDTMMQEEFLHFSAAHLNQPVTTQPLPIDNDRLVMIVLGSLRQHKYGFIDIYSEEAVTTIKAIVKQTVIEAIVAADDIDTDNTAVSLANQMRLLNYTQWMELLNNLFSNLLVILNRVKMVSDLIMEVVTAVSDRSPVHVPRGSVSRGSVTAQTMFGVSEGQSSHAYHDDYMHDDDDDDEQSLHEENREQDLSAGSNGAGSENSAENSSADVVTDESEVKESIKHLSGGDVEMLLSSEENRRITSLLQDMLHHLTDQSHERCLKVIVARGKDGFLERLTSGEFVQLSVAIERFVDDSEKISGKRTTLLRSSLQGQASKFVGRFHEERKQKLSLILDSERWKQADVPAEFQVLVDYISSSGKFSIPSQKPEKDRKPQEYLYVDGEKYAVVGTVLMLLKMMVEYCGAADDIPSAAHEILLRISELLKMFNSRTCQLILGAGALHLVGLKTISTKNLGLASRGLQLVVRYLPMVRQHFEERLRSLASRCLQLVVRYLPIVRQHFEERLSSKHMNMLKHLDHLLKDYNDHISEISVKLVSIIDGMLEANLAKWEVKAPMPSASFRAVIKQITKLHESIHDLLPAQQLKEVFLQLHISLTRILKTHLTRFNVTNDGHPQHGLVMSDVTFYTTAVKSLPQLSDLDLNVDSIWDRR